MVFLGLYNMPQSGYHGVIPHGLETFMASRSKMKIEGGSGGKRGHSNMAHWERTESLKAKADRARRRQVRALKCSALRGLEL